MAKKRKSGNTKAEAEEPIKKIAKNIEEEESSDESEEESSEQSSEEGSDDQKEDQNDDASKRETLKQLLEPFSKDQIIEFLKLAAAQDPTLIARITQSAESDPVHRKLFVFGLGWDATHDQVLAAFSQYGAVDDCKVVTDKATGRAKGFAFLTFKTRASAQKALQDKQIKVGSRMASCQLASAGPAVEWTGRKIFVANVGAHVSPEAIRGFFEKFGELEEGPLGMDGVTGKFKGFAIFTYKSGEGCRKALEEPIKVFDNCRLECRKAVDGLKNSKNQNQQQPQQQQQQQNNGFVGGDVVGGLGYNPGFYAAGLNPLMVGQSAAGFGLVNPMMAAAASALNQTGLGGNAQAALGFSGGYGINSVSPSVIGSYASQAALQGLGAYQGSQLGSSSAGSPAAVAARPQSAAFGSTGKTFPSYFGR